MLFVDQAARVDVDRQRQTYSKKLYFVAKLAVNVASFIQEKSIGDPWFFPN